MALTKIKTGGITDSAVTTAKINNNAVTDAKVADAITVTGAQTGITQTGTLTGLTINTDGGSNTGTYKQVIDWRGAGTPSAYMLRLENSDGTNTPKIDFVLQDQTGGANEINSSLALRLGSGGSTTMYLDSSQKVGISTASPENLLTIRQTENATESNITQDSDTWGVLVETGNYTADRFVGMIAHRNANKEAQTGIWSEITGSGSLMHLGTSSDYDVGVNVKNMTLKHDGTVNFPGSITSVGTLHVGKDSSASSAVIEIGCGSGDYKLSTFNSTFTTNGAFVSDGATLDADDNLSGGLSIISRHASGQIRFYTGGYSDSYKRLHIDDSGNVVMQTGKGLYFDGGSHTYIKEGSGDTLNFYTGGNNTMTLNDHLLITGQLRVYDGAQMGGRLYYSDSSNILTLEANEVSGDNMRIKANNAIYFDDAGGTVVAINGDYLGVGQNSPSKDIHIQRADGGVACRVAYSSTYWTDYSYDFIDCGASTHWDIRMAGDTDFLFYNDGVAKKSSGAGDWANYSDSRLKTNIEDLSVDALATLNSLRPVEFNWKKEELYNTPKDSNGKSYGFIAQEIESTMPQLVTEGELPRDDEQREYVDEDGMAKSTELGHMASLYIKAIQQLTSRIEALENA